MGRHSLIQQQNGRKDCKGQFDRTINTLKKILQGSFESKTDEIISEIRKAVAGYYGPRS